MEQAKRKRRSLWVALSALLLLALGGLTIRLIAGPQPGQESSALAAGAEHTAAAEPAEEETVASGRNTQQMHYPSYGELYLWGSERSGLQLELTGRFHALDGTEDWLPAGFQPGDSAAVVYKYTVGCCPKHAAPAVVLLPGIEAQPGYSELASGDWLRVVGTFALSSGNPPLPMVEAAVLEAAEAPEEELEQLFPTDEMPRSCTGSFPELNYPPGRP